MEWILNRHFWVVHLVLIGLLALAAASIASRLVERRLNVAPGLVEPANKRSVKPPTAKGKPLSFYSVILDKNVFRAVVEEAPPKEKPVADQTIDSNQIHNLAKTPLDIRLRGTAVRDAGSSFAVIEDQHSRREELYHVGDMILGEAKLVQVFRDRVVILRDGKQEVLELSVSNEIGKSRRVQAATQKSPPVVPGRGIQRLTADRWSISREELESARTNMSQLMTQIRITPNFTGGNPDGFRLLSIKRGSLFDRLGLRNGDIVREVNGVPLDSPQKALELYEGIENGQSISLGIVRGGKDQTLTYEFK